MIYGDTADLEFPSLILALEEHIHIGADTAFDCGTMNYLLLVQNIGLEPLICQDAATQREARHNVTNTPVSY